MLVPDPYVLAVGVTVIIACGLGICALLMSPGRRSMRWRLRSEQLERERDVAAGLGWTWRLWVSVRLTTVALAVAVGAVSGLWVLALVLVIVSAFGVRFIVAGRAARRQLARDRAFVAMVRELRDRMAVSNQSLDTALLELAAQPPSTLEGVLAPLSRGGLISEELASGAELARSAVVEQACGVLMWARTRSLDALVATIDTVLVPIAEAQLAVEEESLVTLTQQRAVSLAMATLMVVMFLSVARVASFHAYYSSPVGTVVSLLVVTMFCVLVGIVGRIARPTRWTRWDMRTVAALEQQNHG